MEIIAKSFQLLMDMFKLYLGDFPEEEARRLSDLIGSQPDMQYVGQFANPLALLLAVRDATDRDARAGAVIVPMQKDGSEPGVCSHLISEYPWIVILVISPTKNRGELFRAVMLREKMHDTTDAGLLAAIRGARIPSIYPYPE